MHLSTHFVGLYLLSTMFYPRLFYFVLINSYVQVPLLLSIGEEDLALMKATECGDTDLVYLVLFHIWQKVLLHEILIF